MSKVFITNANVNMISKSLRTKSTALKRGELLETISLDFQDEFEGTNFYDNVHILFNTQELKEIYFKSLIFKNFEKLLQEIDGNKKILEEYVNNANKLYLYPVKAPSYHSISKCELLNSDFSNVKIPDDCGIDAQLKETIKSWLNQHKNLEFEDLNAKFKIEFELDCGLEEIKKKNSGSSDFDNNKIEIDTAMKKLKNNFRQLRFFFDHEFVEKIKKLQYASTYKLKSILKFDKDFETHKVVEDFHSVKESTRQLIHNHYKNKYNRYLSFDKRLLDAIGFHQCRGCRYDI